ncbi:MAG: tRNA (N(6)-L-threonylcarbamoyladenosine(37)-C(2))-methylthiotransferase MtaB [Muribaculaceae bacterium]|nr:tRNA (N(6)-L-threonylcarbamoyladenosine(37)-C(2))-methylthiotransferase MtaB [Muribaculaceae bacterium]
MNLKATYHTLGCKLNFSETATIARMLETKGIERAEKGEAPNICVVNTCSVTSNADKKGRQLIRSLASRYPEAAIMVTGCYAQLKPEEVAKLPNVAIVIGSNEKLRISQYIDEWMKAGSVQVETTPPLSIGKFMPSCERGERTRFFLKVQDGCDYFCTYCTIPFARGRSRSGKISELIPLAQEAAAKGGKEIVITGVNIGTFGKDHEEDFLSLLKALENVEGIERYRISSIEPNLLTDEILDWIANVSGKFMPHFHIPLQSGSDKVLKLMNRRYDTSLFESRIKRIRELIVDAFIGVDVIAGARGETSDEWKRSIDFMESLDVAKFHAFPYSEREGTKAILLGDVVAQDERYRRVGIINELSQKKTLNFIGRNFDKERDVLWEHTTASNMIQGFTDNYIRVEAPMKEGIVNHISKVKIAGMKPGSNEIVIGECL